MWTITQFDSPFKIFLPLILFFFLDSDFSLVALFKLVLKIFRQVLKTCSHLMLNVSGMLANEATSENWKKHHWLGYYITKLKKKILHPYTLL
jgi:hypothetical protein